MRSILARFAVVLLLALHPAWAHQPPPAEDSAQTAIFSGIVTAVSASSITVNRKGLGPDSVTRTFAIDANTRIEGKLRPRAKVTVMYAATDDGMLAVRIIVR